MKADVACNFLLTKRQTCIICSKANYLQMVKDAANLPNIKTKVIKAIHETIDETEKAYHSPSVIVLDRSAAFTRVQAQASKPIQVRFNSV